MTQAQQPEALRLAAICESKGMFSVADELNRMHARLLELEQGKYLHQIAEPAAAPFMYAIADGYGKAFFEEQGCVSSEAKDLQPEVDSLNQNLDGEPPYAVVAVYTHPAAPQAVQAAVPVDKSPEMQDSAVDKSPDLQDSPVVPAHPAEGVPAQGMDAKSFLSESDYEDLWSFEGMASDGEGYDISKERMKRLAELGVVHWCGKDRYCMTAFGQYVLKAWDHLPLETYEESNARCNAEFKARIDRLNAEAIAAQAKRGSAQP